MFFTILIFPIEESIESLEDYQTYLGREEDLDVQGVAFESVTKTLSLIHSDLECVPHGVIDKFWRNVTSLDLSYNKIE